jgi:hypothetical protein
MKRIKPVSQSKCNLNVYTEREKGRERERKKERPNSFARRSRPCQFATMVERGRERTKLMGNLLFELQYKLAG